jgi:subtilisin family serine protease
MKSRIIIVLSLAVAAVSCARTAREELLPQDLNGTEPRIFGANLPEKDIIPGILNLYVDETLAETLEAATGKDGWVEVASVKSMESAGVVRLRRLFPYAGEFEARTRADGLHRWYEAWYDESIPVTKAAGGFTPIPGIELIEYNPRIEIVGNPELVEILDAGDAPIAQAASGRYPFDDPFLPSQWDYYNDGSRPGAEGGCDINVLPVWRAYTTGKSNVIVGVVDGGIDYSHEDLAANMWTNPEKTGNYRYGYNFVNDTYLVTADSHGTHVAGTIAAVNNNGKGVCGIAGGDAGSNVKGVKLMSCQIFQGNESGNGATAIKWSADHGAVISQNSWGYTTLTETPASLKAAVDYFVKRAGCEATEPYNQRADSPMKGGIVIFAAGNENRNYSANSYAPIYNVASVGADYRKAYYSCYGSWVDISAPGGDARKGNQILSTIPGNRYGIMQGTSMACPHVSGVAALIVSKSGTKGFTPDALIKKMNNSATPIASFNPNFQMGAGLINAFRAIAGSGGKAPKTPSNLAISVQSNNLHVSVTVPEDEDDGVPNAIQLYYSKADFTKVSSSLMFSSLYVGDLNPGETLTGTVSGLDFNETYYVAAVASDLIGNQSSLTSRIQIVTQGNNPPELQTSGPLAASIKPHESCSFDFDIVEPDGHFVTIELDPGSEGVVLDTTVRESPKVKISGRDIPSGSYRATLTVADYYGAYSEAVMDYTVLENHKPYVKSTLPDRIFSSRTSGTEELSQTAYFADDDGENLEYSFAISNETVVNMTAQNGKFFLTPMNYGYADVTITGTDVRGEKAIQTFHVLVRDGSSAWDIYPNPVRTDLYIRSGQEATCRIKIISSSGSVFYEKTTTVTPFEPLKVDMGKASPGVYTVLVDNNKYNVVKL